MLVSCNIVLSSNEQLSIRKQLAFFAVNWFDFAKTQAKLNRQFGRIEQVTDSM